ncbi:uncharacterized protein LOC108145670 [Drosophila elegans]|uniref:uncharacterized protein LOC108145670 n=1 Tax=Drosophila elegans TaxID=30023 RepID=UPI0007E86A94|nr:uncharacterized protein LOC108145670 [Drosophila elegans]
MAARIKYTKKMVATRRKRIIQAKLRTKPQTAFDRRLLELERRINRLTREVRDYKLQYCRRNKIIFRTSEIPYPFELNLEFMQGIESIAVQLLVDGQKPIFIFTS